MICSSIGTLSRVLSDLSGEHLGSSGPRWGDEDGSAERPTPRPLAGELLAARVLALTRRPVSHRRMCTVATPSQDQIALGD